MARDTLIGVYCWPPDYDGDVTCYTVWLKNNHYDISRCGMYHNNKLTIEDNELKLGPKAIVEWSKE